MEELLERFKIDKYSDRNFAIYDGEDLVCVMAYRKGAEEVRRRMIGYELLLMKIKGVFQYSRIKYENLYISFLSSLQHPRCQYPSSF
jgi:hypothetical protein